MMSNNFYSNDLMVQIRIEERMAEAEAYRRAAQVEQSNQGEQPAPLRCVGLVGFGGWLCASAGLELELRRIAILILCS
jgi:hypothetical protein